MSTSWCWNASFAILTRVRVCSLADAFVSASTRRAASLIGSVESTSFVMSRSAGASLESARAGGTSRAAPRCKRAAARLIAPATRVRAEGMLGQ